MPAPSSTPRPQLAAVGFAPSFHRQSSVFLAQLLAAERPHRGLELDETASSLALYARAAGAASSTQAGVDLTI
jgi:hypothetical protein